MLAVSEADPYVILQLPTAPGTKFKTKTVTNSSHPVWNETFTFLIQGEVKVKVRVSLATHLRTGCTTHTNVLGWSTPFCWRRKWQSSPVLLPGKSHGQRSLVGCSPWGRKESDTTERLHFHFYTFLWGLGRDLGNGVSVCSSQDVLYARGYVNSKVMVLPKPVYGVEA